MSRKSSDSGLGCALTLIFIPFVLFFIAIKGIISLCSKGVKTASQANNNQHNKSNYKFNKINTTKGNKYAEDYWETHCESCGELLEDCECDWQDQSREDISQDMDDLEFDEMNDIWDEEDGEF
jgi:hypothetical protein